MNKLKSYARQAFRALEYIHNKGIIHADIKLANFALCKETDDSEVLKIIDFGLSLVGEEEEEHKVHLNNCIGTIGYMAPEVLDKREIIVGPEIDIWSMGICLYKMCVAYSPEQVKKYHYCKPKILIQI
jgi:serine/threonine protein kinase